jgi:hypothetical protein
MRNIPVKGDRNLDNGRAGEMLASAVNLKSFQYPLCAHLTVIHTNGTAIAALTARSIFISIRYLQGMLLQREKEMLDELIFTPDVVETHLRRLRRIQSISSGLVSRGNLLSQCYCQILNADDIYAVLEKVSKKLDEEIVEKIDEFYKSIDINVGRHQQVEPWKSKIHNLIKEEIPPLLAELSRVLFDTDERAANLLKGFEDDWQHDLTFLWKDHLCQPSAVSAPERPKIVPSSLSSMN